jgi:hypothetical protein
LRRKKYYQKWLDANFSFANFPMDPTVDDLEAKDKTISEAW